jgi:hypothetical protein
VARLLSNENGWSRALLPWLLPGCLVSFNDYPLGNIEGASGAASAGGAASGGRGGAESPSSTAGTPNEAGGGGEPSDAGGASGMLGAGENMIDDFQDSDQAILEQQGRKGAWYVANDGMGVQTPRVGEPLLPSLLMPARGSSTRAIHTFGGPFSTWGALIGTSLAMAGDRGAEYDLSGFQGLRLWVRRGSMVAGSARSVRLNLPTPATNSGGTCTVCNDHFGFDVPLTWQWVQVEVPFSSLEQQGYGRPALASPDLRHVTSLQLGFDRNIAFDLWVDDIELY